MQLEADEALFQSFGLFVINDFRGELAINREPKSMAFHKDMNLIPIIFPNIHRRQRIRYQCNRFPAILPNRNPLAALREIIASIILMEVPGTKNLVPDSDVTDIGMIAMEPTLLAWHRLTPNLHPRIRLLTEQSIAKRQLKITQLTLKHKVGLLSLTLRMNGAVLDCPIAFLSARAAMPTI